MTNDNEECEPKKMAQTNYPSNSHKSRDNQPPEKEERPKVERVTNSEAVRRKTPLGRRIAESFTGEDAKGVTSFVFFDVIVPSAKAMILEAVNKGLERKFYGNVTGRTRPGSGIRNGQGRTSYNLIPNRNEPVSGSQRDLSNRARATHDYDEVVLATRGEAEIVLERLGDLVDQYDVARVADLYDLIGVTPSYTDDKYGWYDLRGSKVIAVRGGYLLDLPKTEEITS